MTKYYVYFIQEQPLKGERCAPFKIGMAADVEKRRGDLQVGNPRKLRIRAAIQVPCRDDAIIMERCLHHLAAKRFKHVNGEWFRIYGGLSTLMKQAAKMAHVDDVELVRFKDPDKEKDKRIRQLEKEVADLKAQIQPSY